MAFRPLLSVSYRTVVGKTGCSCRVESLTSTFFSTRNTFSTAVEGAKASENLSVQSFLKSVGGGVENNAAKVAQEVPDLAALLRTRSGRLKKLGISCQQRKRILRFTEQYRQGVWRPSAASSQEAAAK
eukprot:jgi/Mesen1/10553/ME000083S10053